MDPWRVSWYKYLQKKVDYFKLSYGINAEEGAINTLQRNLMRPWLSLPWQGPLRAAGRPAPPDLTATLVRVERARSPRTTRSILQCTES